MKSYSDYISQITENVEHEPLVELSIPLLIRLMEYAREDAKTDMDLHFVAENLTKLKRCAEMKDYKAIISKR